ncbi:MAG: hypothetical protein U0L09_03935 [Christensenellales bacterium]|nr:hypothetical protein [Christensenellales bacterium]
MMASRSKKRKALQDYTAQPAKESHSEPIKPMGGNIMIKLTTKGRAPRLYDCFGEKITAKEGADRLGISIHTMRNRLQLYGDNMEEVMHFYQNREEKRSEPKIKKFTEPEERAIAEIAEILCGGG